MVTSKESAHSFIDYDKGLMSRDVFVSPDVYQQELEQVFARTWLLIGHESMVPKPNDFYVSRMGEESVILTRDRQGELHVLLNTCMHRGMKVCRYDEGNTPVFSCPYHGWSYSTDGNLVSVPGELIGVPQFATAYHGELKKEEWGLISVPKVKNYKGTIWACWDATAPSFEEYMGDMLLYLDAVLDSRDGREGGSEAIAGVWKWRVPTNWKFGAENFLGDHYHAISHRSVELVDISPGMSKAPRSGTAMPTTFRGNVSFAEGHGSGGGPPEPGGNKSFPAFPQDPATEAYFQEVREAREKRLAEQLKAPAATGTIFPNVSFHGWFPRGFAVWHPAGPTETEIWRFYLVDKDAPAGVKQLLARYYMRYGGPVGLTEQDDMENWNYATAASAGTLARRYPYNYAMGKGYEEPVEGLRHAHFTPGTSEQNPRVYYSRWADLMDGKSWDELKVR